MQNTNPPRRKIVKLINNSKWTILISEVKLLPQMTLSIYEQKKIMGAGPILIEGRRLILQ